MVFIKKRTLMKDDLVAENFQNICLGNTIDIKDISWG